MASRMNGYRLKASQAEAEATLTVLSAAGDITEEEFATWIREHAVKRK
jgi:death-on-curing protein